MSSLYFGLSGGCNIAAQSHHPSGLGLTYLIDSNQAHLDSFPAAGEDRQTKILADDPARLPEQIIAILENTPNIDSVVFVSALGGSVAPRVLYALVPYLESNNCNYGYVLILPFATEAKARRKARRQAKCIRHRSGRSVILDKQWYMPSADGDKSPPEILADINSDAGQIMASIANNYQKSALSPAARQAFLQRLARVPMPA